MLECVVLDLKSCNIQVDVLDTAMIKVLGEPELKVDCAAARATEEISSSPVPNENGFVRRSSARRA